MNALQRHNRHHPRWLSATITTVLALIIAVSVTQLGVVRGREEGMNHHHHRDYHQAAEAVVERVVAMTSRRRMAGLGSSPPTCRSKCGNCAPCQAVHVPIHPGASVPLEYYPEAWRCKCGNKLFMP